ncbi:SpaH/EbpB family LPXTG-anchored major pilin [Xylanimonas protaetiae]|uniref:SpaH/EbpB family LPXTG-anchored major pilin n=1 Tax=Xylanimonas protaetiae TaxID=2509457 RepID=UPI0013EBC927|nr:SpaH/EbpB family LPXTG-anchored major pilin [Xylanimonas protaetiae]
MKRPATWLVALAAAFALSLAAPVAASAASIDPSRPCSLTVRKYLVGDDDATLGTPDAGAVFALGRVPGVDLTTTEGWLAAEALAGQDPATVTTEPVRQGVTDADGEVAFRNLALGLYKVTEVAPDGADVVAPFLVTLPMTDPVARDKWLYDVVASPKVTPSPADDAPVYDLALRTWVSEVWRDGARVFERQSPTTDTGPEFVVPHVTFDDPTVDIRVGDLVVHDIHLFNQGNRTARVDELVNHSAAGLDYAGGLLMNTVPGHDNDGWELAADGLWHMSMEEAGIVLAPGEDFEVHLTLQVLPEALGSGVDVADHYSFVEISKFSGWVPTSAEPAQNRTASAGAVTASNVAFGVDVQPRVTARPLAATTYDGVPGTWQQVADVDSTPARTNLAVERDRLVYHSWEDNEIDESNTSMSSDDERNDYDNDEDDHDGTIIQVVRDLGQATTPPVVRLPRTGAEIGAAAAAAVVLVVAGACIVGAVRRRRDREVPPSRA